jgi:hypothetical protein
MYLDADPATYAVTAVLDRFITRSESRGPIAPPPRGMLRKAGDFEALVTANMQVARMVKSFIMLYGGS